MPRGDVTNSICGQTCNCVNVCRKESYAARSSNAGTKHYRWSGDDASYTAKHIRMRKILGKASIHKCVRCTERGINKQARNWAQVHVTDGTDPFADYVPLCLRCHHHYDRDSFKGRPVSAETRAKISASLIRRAWNGQTPPPPRSTAARKPNL